MTLRWRYASLLPIGIALALAGCVVGPNYKKVQPETPAAFTESKDSGTTATLNLAQWWNTFDDPELTSVIDRAAKANLDLRLAEARIREARATLRQSRSGFFPTLDTQGSYTRSRRSGGSLSSQSNGSSSGTQGTSGSGSTSSGSSGSSKSSSGGGGSSLENDLYHAGFDAAWELDIFGGVQRQVEADTAEIAVAVEGRNDALVTLLAEVGANYISARGAQTQLIITQKNLQAQLETVDLTRDRLRAGISGQLDVSRAEALAATTRAQLSSLQTSLAQAIHRLGILLAESPGALTQEFAESKPVPAAREGVAVGVPADLLRRRPDIRRAEREVAAATARIGVATADLYPKFSLVGSLGLQSTEFNDLFHGKSRFWSIGPSVSWPIFDAGRIRAGIEIQNARQEQAFITYEQAVLTALEDTENALSAYANERNHHEALARAVAANREAADLSNELFMKGLADFLTVLDAERTLFASETDLTLSETALSADLVALYKALGGGWDAPAEGGAAGN